MTVGVVKLPTSPVSALIVQVPRRFALITSSNTVGG
jgi:hypothetical protein